MKTKFLLSVLVFISLFTQGQDIKWYYYSGDGSTKYVGYDQIEYTENGITYQWYLLDLPAEVLSTSYFKFSDEVWDTATSSDWASQFGDMYLFQQKGKRGAGTAWMLAYDTYNESSTYEMSIEVSINDSTLSNYYSDYGVGFSYTTVYDTVTVVDTLIVVDTIVGYDTVTVAVGDTYSETFKLTEEEKGISVFNSITFKMYPIPASSTLHLYYTPDIFPQTIHPTFAIYNMSGEVVVSDRLYEMTSNLDISHLKTGTYVIRIFTDDKVWINRTFVVAH